MTLPSGTRLGTYQITGPLGAGGMGEVYRARDTRLGREVAIKVLPSNVASNPDRLARFEREARAVAGLNHPHIVTLHSVEDEDGVRFLTMELVDGRSLDTLVTPGGLPLHRVLDLAIPLANALVAAHERGVVHRDLKPGNVMVTHDGWVKVLDFGLAKIADEAALDPIDTLGVTANGPISGVGQVLGTVPYMAPEQIRGETADARTDLFALGIILFELATGRRPFAGASPADVSSAILRDAAPAVMSLRSDIPRDLNRIITRCLEKNPRDRFQTARDVYNELRYILRDAEGVATPPPSSAMGASGAPSSPPATPAPPTPPVMRSPTSSSSASARSASAASNDVPSIAVLPFVNRSRGEEDEYFSDGLADELLNVLTKIRGLRVAARASSFQFRGTNEDLAVIGERLNVATLLDGSVRKSGNRVRISVQLIKAADRVQLWSETYDRSLDDIFAVQDDIAHSVVRELRTTLFGDTPDSKASGEARAEVSVVAARGHGQSAEAHRLYLQGKYFVDRINQEDMPKGIGYLEQALAIDPSHAAAWAELSRAYNISAGYGWKPLVAATETARKAANRALELAPDMAEGYIRIAAIQRQYDWDWESAEANTRRALELAPGDATILGAAAVLAHVTGHHAEAERFLLTALEKDPLNGGAYTALAQLYRSTDRLADSERCYRKAAELSPQRTGVHHMLAAVLAAQGRDAEALTEVQLEHTEWARLTVLAYIHHRGGRKAESDKALEKLVTDYGDTAAFQIAAVHASRGEVEAAFTWLEQCILDRDAGTPQMSWEPLFRSLHGDPRWAELLKKAGFRR